MASADLSLIRAVPGRLCYAPTQLGMAGAFPHGGTELGVVSDVHVLESEELTRIESEARGKLVAAVRGATQAALGFRLMQWDRDALALFYRTTTTSAGGFADTLQLLSPHPGLVAPLSPVLFSPDDPEHPGVLLLAPIPDSSFRRRLSYELVEGHEFDILLLAALDANGNDIRTGRVCDMSLT